MSHLPSPSGPVGNPPAHLRATVTGRGFIHLPVLQTASGHALRVYESSAALAPHVWLSLDGRTAHLDVPTVTRLAEQLMYLVEHHYLLADDA